MNAVRQGTTPTCIVTVKGYDLTDKTCFVTLQDCNNKTVTKTGDSLTVTYDGADSLIAFRLSQEETFDLAIGKVSLQVRFIGSDAVAFATDIAIVTNTKVLLNQVIKYNGGE